jgi:membrane protease YdiL (CAAX protease family)
MKELIKNNLKYLIFLAIFGLVGGYFTAIYTVQSLGQDMIDEAIAEVGSIDVLIIITTLQSLSYALILGVVGKLLAKKIGLWRKFEFDKKGNVELILVTILGGAAFILIDCLFFSNFSDVIKNSYTVKPIVEYIIASITYGAVIEEVILRLFFMSLIAVIIQKLSKKDVINNKILVVANVISAILFAAAHLPATIMTIGITPMIIIRCFVMNGAFGLMFGRLYRKFGIHYSMLAHCGVHIVSKLIWILFI